MIEYTYYKSGDWKVACSICGEHVITQSIADAHRLGQLHVRRCGT